MNTVQPIRDKQKIEEFLKELKAWNHKYYILAYAGFYSGLRISDLLLLKVEDMEKTHFTVKETKTGNTRRIKINNHLRAELDKYIKDKPAGEYLFRQKHENKPMSRQYAHKVLSEAAKRVGIEDKISTHSLRKSFGYHMYQATKDVVLLQEIFGHSAPSVTLRYIGYNDDMIDIAIDNFKII